MLKEKIFLSSRNIRVGPWIGFVWLNRDEWWALVNAVINLPFA